MHERAGKGLNDVGGNAPKTKDTMLEKATSDNSEISDIFPSLVKYKNEHNAVNLQKLLVELLAFCQSIYASTQCDAERKIYHSFIDKLNN